MFGSGRTVGIIIIIGGLLLACGGSAVSIVSVNVDADGTKGGMVLGVVLSLLVATPVVGLGAFLFWRGRNELAELAQIKQQKKILNMVKTQGQVEISEVVFEKSSSKKSNYGSQSGNSERKGCWILIF